MSIEHNTPIKVEAGAIVTSDSAVPIRRRNKPTLVCNNCKRRKVKCDRKIPCTSCVKVNCGFTCSYEARPVRQDGKRKKKIAEEEDSYAIINGSHYGSSSGEEDEQRNSQYEILALKRRLARLEGELKPTYYKYDHHTEEDYAHHPNVKPAADFNAPQISSKSDYLSPEVNFHLYNPTVSEDEKINFYDGYSTLHLKEPFRRANFGPLSWTSLMQRDFWISLFRTSVDCKYTDPNVYPSLYTSALPNIPKLLKHLQKNQESDFQKTALQGEGIYELAPLKFLTENFKSGENKTLPAGSLALGKTLFEGKFDNDLHLAEKIKQILPKKKVFWLLINKFFSNLYAFMPYLDEISFKKDLESIFGVVELTDVPFTHIKIEKKLDLASVAIALIVLRMTCLSLFSNRSCVNDLLIQNEWIGEDYKNAREMKYLMINPINVSVISVAQLCIDSFQLSRKINLTIFQSVLYMRLYHTSAPEDGDYLDGGDSQVSTALLIQMAYSLGINREPLLFPDILKNPKINNLTRKIWHFLLRSDIFHSFNIGNPPSIDFRHFDTSPPYLEAGNENCKSQAVEAAVADSFYYFYIRINYFRRLLDIILDINKFTPVNKITSVMNNLEKCFREEFMLGLNDDKYEAFNQDYMTPNNFHAILSVRYVVSTGSAMVSIYYHLYLHYEKTGNYELTFFYLKKMFKVIMDFIIPYCKPIINGKLSKEGFFLNPTLMMGIHKVNQVCISALTRILYIRYSFESSKEHQSRLRNDKQYYQINHCYKVLGAKLHKLGVTCTKIFSKFSSRYYFAWRIYKAHGYLFHAIHDDTSYENMHKNPTSSKARMFQFTLSQIEDLTSTVDEVIRVIVGSIGAEDACTEYELLDLSSREGGKQRQMGDEKSHPFSFSLTPLYSPTDNKAKKKKMSSSKNGTPINDLDTSIIVPSMTATSSVTDGGSTPEIIHHNHYVDQMWLLMLALRNNVPNDVSNFSTYSVDQQQQQQPQQVQMTNNYPPMNQQQFYQSQPDPITNISITSTNRNNSPNILNPPPPQHHVDPLLNNMNEHFMNSNVNSDPNSNGGPYQPMPNVQGNDNGFPSNPNTNVDDANPNFSEILFMAGFDIFANGGTLDQLL